MYRYEELSTGQLAELAPKAVFLLPMGSLEQHCQGPLGTDLMIAQGVAEAACERLEAAGLQCVLTPPVAYGFSWEWSGAPGTVSLPLDVVKGLVSSVIGSLARAGARAVAIVNGHYGNWPAVEAALRELMPTLGGGPTVVLVNYWQVLGIDVGHASDAEAEVLRALGREVSFGECQNANTSPTGAPTFRGSLGISRVPARYGGRLSRDAIGGAVATAIAKALEAAKGSPVLP